MKLVISFQILLKKLLEILKIFKGVIFSQRVSSYANAFSNYIFKIFNVICFIQDDKHYQMMRSMFHTT